MDRRLTQEQLRAQALTDGIVQERRMIRASGVAATRAAERLISGQVTTRPIPQRALSLTWPWPYFMLDLPPELRKTVENRKPGFSHKSFRGECWVHVTKPKRIQDFYDACAFALDHGVPRELLPSLDFQFIGHIVGRWNIVGMLPEPDPDELPDRWRMAGQVGFVVEAPRLVKPVACKGALGFWYVPDPVLAELGKVAR